MKPALLARAFTSAIALSLAAQADARFLQVDPVGYDDQFNLYTYVGNDPLNGKDPSGKVCIVAQNGTTTCATSNYNVTFPTPQGFRNTDPRASDYHQYHIDKISPLSAPETRQWVTNNPTPGNPSPATPNGTANDATPRPLFGLGPSPVTSFSTQNSVTGNQVVVNVTMPGHPLGNGIVVRDTTAGPNGTSVIHNFGEGNGELQKPGAPLAGAINNTWAWPGMAPPPKLDQPPQDPCMKNPGRC